MKMTKEHKRKIFLGVAILTFCIAGSIKAQGWRGIKPLHSTREDVEHLIGPPMRDPKDSVYDLRNERVNVTYADAPCVKDWPYGWNVKPGTVVAITIYPQQRPKLAELSIDISKSTKYVDRSGIIHYNNDDQGVSVAVDPNEYEVTVIEYYAAASDVHLRCPAAAARQREIEKGEGIVRFPDVSYSDSSPEDKQFYLNALAAQFEQASSDSIVYVIGYAGQRARVGEAMERANAAKIYLTRKQHIEPKRIVTIDGGHRDPAGVDLFITLRGQPKPLPSPNVYPGNVKILDDPISP